MVFPVILMMMLLLLLLLLASTTVDSLLVVHPSSISTPSSSRSVDVARLSSSSLSFVGRRIDRKSLLGKLSLSANNDNDDDYDDNIDDEQARTDEDDQTTVTMMESLSRRIKQLENERASQERRQWDELELRIQKMEVSNAVERRLSMLDDADDDYYTDDDYDSPSNIRSRVIQLPVICMDALLPGQQMEGRTQDTTFGRFLQDVGVGGYFVMTSLEVTTRTVRRHGVVVKLLAVDATAKSTTNNNDNGSSSSTTRWYMGPTAVDFALIGQSRCRVVGPSPPQRQENDVVVIMKKRIGRWRRSYDPNGEESCLGWGEERFVNAAPTTMTTICDDDLVTFDGIIDQDGPLLMHGRKADGVDTESLTEHDWSSCWIEIQLERYDRQAFKVQVKDDPNLATMVRTSMIERIIPMAEEWYRLASDISTYENLNVTATSRIQRDATGLWIDPQKLLKQVMARLGPKPEYDVRREEELDVVVDVDPTPYLFWVVAFINPIPPLGVSMEIRGKLLEARSVEERLRIVEVGLSRSIDNLTGKRPL